MMEKNLYGKPHRIESAKLWFIDNKLYQIKLIWQANGNGYFDVEHFESDVRNLFQGLMNKYKREDISDSSDDKASVHYWLNPQRHITFTQIYSKIDAATRSRGVTACSLAYNDSKLLEKANSLKKSIDALEEAHDREAIQKDKQEKIEAISKQL